MMNRLTVQCALLACAVLTPVIAQASCVSPPYALADAYEDADAIVTGILIECETLDSKSALTGSRRRCTFAPLEVMKAAEPSRDYSGIAQSSQCGARLTVGNEYLFYLDPENKPLRITEIAPADAIRGGLVSAYVAILRDFRDGRTSDLSEPWFLTESKVVGSCSLTHRVGRDSITISRRKKDAPPFTEIDWNEMKVDGRPLFTPEEAAKLKREIAANPPPPEASEPTVAIMFSETGRIAPPNATMRVGERSWTLGQLDGDPGIDVDYRVYQYYVSGERAEDILSALETPSEVVVTVAREQQDAAKPDLRLETRSTQLARTIDSYRSCYAAASD